MSAKLPWWAIAALMGPAHGLFRVLQLYDYARSVEEQLPEWRAGCFQFPRSWLGPYETWDGPEEWSGPFPGMEIGDEELR